MSKIQFNHITFGYDRRLLFEEAGLDLHMQQLNILVGKSGVGKTSLLEILSKRIAVSNITCSDAQWQGLGAKELAAHYIAYHLIDAGYMKNLTVRQNIEETKLAFDEAGIGDQLIEIFQFKSLLNRYPDHLSGGQQRILSVILSLMRDLPIVFLDEPTASLDQSVKEKFIVFLKDYVARGHTVLLATNDADVYSSADHLLKIENQKIICDGCQVENTKLEKKEHIQSYRFKTILYRQRWQKFCLVSLMMFTSVFLGWAINKNGAAVLDHQKLIENANTFYENTMYCFYPPFIEADAYFPFAKVVPETIKDDIQCIDGVKNVYPYYTIPLGLTQDSGGAELGKFKIRINEDKPVNTTDEEVFMAFYYPEQREGEGIYISEAFLNRYNLEAESGDVITATIALPVAVGEGTVYQNFVDENGNETEILLDTLSKKYRVVNQSLTISGTHHISSLYFQKQPLIYAPFSSISDYIDIQQLPTNAYVIIIDENTDIEKIKDSIYAIDSNLAVKFPAMEEKLIKTSLYQEIHHTYLLNAGVCLAGIIIFVLFMLLLETFNKKDRRYLYYSGLSKEKYCRYRTWEYVLLACLTAFGAVIGGTLMIENDSLNILFSIVSGFIFVVVSACVFHCCLRRVTNDAGTS